MDPMVILAKAWREFNRKNGVDVTFEDYLTMSSLEKFDLLPREKKESFWGKDYFDAEKRRRNHGST